MIFFPADRRENAVQDDGRFGDIDKLVKMKKSRAPQHRKEQQTAGDLDEVSRLKIANKGRLTFLPEAKSLKVLVEDPDGFESDVKYETNQSSFNHKSTDSTNTLILVSAEDRVVEELKQAVATSKKKLRLHVLDFIPTPSLECGDDEFAVRRVQSPTDTPS